MSEEAAMEDRGCFSEACSRSVILVQAFRLRRLRVSSSWNGRGVSFTRDVYATFTQIDLCSAFRQKTGGQRAPPEAVNSPRIQLS